MKQGYTIEITNCTDRDLTWQEYQGAMSNARTLDELHTHLNPLVIDTTVKTVLNYAQNRGDLVFVKILNLSGGGEP